MKFRLPLLRSIRGRLLLGVTLLHAVLMTLFIADITVRQKHFVQEEGKARAFGLARMMAVTSTSWVLADDIQGLAEVMEGVRAYPEVAYAMILDPRLRVLGHSDTALIDTHLIDDASLGLLQSRDAVERVLFEDEDSLDVATPIMVENIQIGWARLRIDLSHQAGRLQEIARGGLIYLVLAIVIGAAIAFWVSSRLTAELRHLGTEADHLRQGRRQFTPLPRPADEVRNLERDLVSMAQTIWKREDDLAQERDNLERKVTERTVELLDEVAERRAAQSRTEAALAARELAMREQRNFLSMVSHEFRTPLSIIAGAASILSEYAAEPEETIAQAERIHGAVGRLGRMVDSLLADDLVDGAAADLRMAPVDLAALIHHITAEFRDLDPTRRISLRVSGNGELAAEQRLIQVAITNLMDNACKYSPPGSPIEVELDWRQGMVCIQVSDAGMGIRPEDMGRIFEKFFRGNAAERKSGTGIGLHLVKHIAELHGGTVEASSEPGVGSRFTIRLPCTRRDAV